jgi:hypothetical protein
MSDNLTGKFNVYQTLSVTPKADVIYNCHYYIEQYFKDLELNGSILHLDWFSGLIYLNGENGLSGFA